jgi:hypothetical protein
VLKNFCEHHHSQSCNQGVEANFEASVQA